MTEHVKIQALLRDGNGTGDARAIRREGRIPAIIYGGKQEETGITIEEKNLYMEYVKGGFTSKIVEIDVNGKVQKAIPREVQVHPVTDRPLHVDFQRVVVNELVKMFVKVNFINETQSPGLKRGGILNIVRRRVEFFCPAENVPDAITVDLAGLQIGYSIHISHIELPAGIKPVIKRDFTVATIVGRSAKDENETATAGADAAAAPAAAGKAAPAAAGKAAPAAAKPAAKK